MTDAFYMKPQTIFLSVTLCVASVPALAQVTVAAAPEVSALMADCTPTDARGAAIVAGLRARGWVEPEAAERREALTTLAAAHLWSFLPDRPAAVQIELLGQLTDAVERALQDGGAFLTLADERALVLWDIDSLSCLWAGNAHRGYACRATGWHVSGKYRHSHAGAEPERRGRWTKLATPDCGRPAPLAPQPCVRRTEQNWPGRW
ncbi:hypothetical protein [Pararhodobacter zhoushanensis]|uniref:Uncharacterized protein n=1 Tax=Pararhodobacter zhoushanensis TaxID=2479545 RepID=A0ABT3H5K0_9RHOB|nr:hypothetical protein [Pararhodobacter zhoushanensis]MCW1935028.1 hypothetical protein [Pararhodobacter zhoushanensis]